jgi:hypothetical protein
MPEFLIQNSTDQNSLDHNFFFFLVHEKATIYTLKSLRIEKMKY